MTERLTLQDLIDLLAKKQGITKKEAETFLRELINVISENIEQNEPVKIKDFGTFKLTKVSARKSVDVNTGEAIEIAAHYKLTFTPDKSLREAINRPFAHFESVLLEDGVSFDNLESKTEDEIVDDIESEEIEISEDAETPEDVFIPTDIEEQSEEVEEATEEIFEANDISQEEVEPQIEPEVVEVHETIIEEEETPPPFIEKPIEEEVVNVIDEQPVAIEESTSPESDKIEDDSRHTPEEQDDDDDDTPFLDPTEERESIWRRMPQWVGVLIVVALVSLAIGFFARDRIMTFFADMRDDSAMTKDQQDAYTSYSSDSAHIADSIALRDTLNASSIVKDSALVKQPAKDEQPATPAKDEKPVAKVEPVKQQPSKTVTIETGQTLRMIGLQHYGHKSFWVYIYQDNKDKIKNPNNVPLGTKLSVPPREKYGIDPKNPQSVKKAREMEEKIFKQFGIH